VKKLGVEAHLCRHWAEGGQGAAGLAKAVVALAEGRTARFKPLYRDDLPLADKIEAVATKIYRAGRVEFASGVRDQLAAFEAMGYGQLPVCMAKTQYSFSADPTKLGAPAGHVVPVREVRLSAGAGFVVAICGDIMTMPGLPREPSAERIHLDEAGLVQGLF
jgi:formate--tetrahydrofolate ligase